MALAERHAKQRAHDGIQTQVGVVRQQRQGHGRVAATHQHVVGYGAQMMPARDAMIARHQPREDRQQRRKGERRQDETEPDAARSKCNRPAGEQYEQRGRGGQRAAQVVEHLPATQLRNGPPAPAEDPRQQLPVAAHPAVRARGGDLDVRRKILEQVDVADQAAAGEHALEEIVAEHRVVRHLAGERAFKCVDVVNAFPGEIALTEQILIDIGDRAGVGIEAGRPGEYPLEQRTLSGRRQGWRDARLEDSVAFQHQTRLRVVTRPVQRMCRGAHQAPHRIDRQAGIGIERDHVAHAFRCARRDAVDWQEGRVPGAAQQAVEFVQLAALAFPAHPFLLRSVPLAAALKQIKAVGCVS